MIAGVLTHEKVLLSTGKSAFFSFIRLQRVILLRSDIRLTPSDIALRAVWKCIDIFLRLWYIFYPARGSGQSEVRYIGQSS